VVMESKAADVGLFILFGLLKTLFKLPFFLETVLLGHLPFFFFGFHDTTLMTEILQFSVKHLVSAELALQTAVIKRNFDAWLQADLLETLLTIGENPSIVTLELML
jgi:hypothetical protein